LDGSFKTVVSRHLRLPLQQRSGKRDIGAPLPGVVGGKKLLLQIGVASL
jgi:hypothetical protein